MESRAFWSLISKFVYTQRKKNPQTTSHECERTKKALVGGGKD